MKILVAIAHHGATNRNYLDRLIQQYRSMPYVTRIVVLSDTADDFGPEVEVRMVAAACDPGSLPLPNRALFAEECDNHDLFIYGQDDVLVTEKNISAFMAAAELLGPDEIAGFLQSEQSADGLPYCPEAHSNFRWVPGSLRQRDGQQFAEFSSHHAALYMLNRVQLKKAIASGGYLAPLQEGRSDLLVTAATDPYSKCGFTKVICVSQLDNFILPHLAKREGGMPGINWQDLRLQVADMLSGKNSGSPDNRPTQNQTPPSRAWLSKNYYEPLKKEILSLMPKSVKSVLSVGSGSGETERYLAESGYRVCGIPLDRIIGLVDHSEGTFAPGPALDAANAEIGDQRFDCVLCDWALHLWPEPRLLLGWISDRLNSDGVLIAGFPNISDYRPLWSRLPRRSDQLEASHQKRVSVQKATRRQLRSWLKQAMPGADRVRSGERSPGHRLQHFTGLRSANLPAKQIAASVKRTSVSRSATKDAIVAS